MARRVAVTVVTSMLMVTAETAATLGPVPLGPRPHRVAVTTGRTSPPPSGGEPRLPAEATAPAAAKAAALRFVRDYALWSGGRLGAIPAGDATERVIWLVEQQPRGTRLSVGDAERSVRITAEGEGRYVVTSAVGNFLVGTQRSQWLVVSLPGD